MDCRKGCAVGVFFVLIAASFIMGTSSFKGSDSPILLENMSSGIGGGGQHPSNVFGHYSPNHDEFYLENGVWKPINLTIKPYNHDGYAYIVNETWYNFSMKENSNWGDGFRFEIGGYSFVFQPSDYSYRNQVGSQDYLQSIQGKTAVVDNSEYTITYGGVFTGVDFQYRMQPRMVKENFVVHELIRPPAEWLGDISQVTLDFGGYIKYGSARVYVNGTDMTGQDFVTSERIEFRDSNGEVVMYHLPRPFAFDSSDKTVNCSYEIKQLGGNQIWFYVRTPYTFFLDAVFPVYVDPSYFGNANVGSENRVIENRFCGTEFTTPFDMDEVTSIWVYVRSITLAGVDSKTAIYDEDLVFVAESDEVVISGGYDGWMEYPFTTPVALDPETVYVFGVSSEFIDGSRVFAKFEVAPFSSWHGDMDYVGGFPSPGPFDFEDGLYSIYVEYEPVVLSPPEPVFLLPNAEGSVQEWLIYPAGIPVVHWDKVDDPVGSPDGDSTYVYTTMLDKIEEFNHVNLSVLYGIPISKVTLWIAARKTASHVDFRIEPGVKIDGTRYTKTAFAVSDAWASYVTEWEYDPSGSLSFTRWTKDVIDGMQSSMKSTGSGLLGGNVRVTQVFFEVSCRYYAGGTGTVADPYRITHLEHLYYVRGHLDKNFTLMNDLDFNDDASYLNTSNKATFTTGFGWLQMGDFYNTNFTGTFNGNNKTISNLFIDRSTILSPSNNYVGLFGHGDDATVFDLGLIDVNIKGREACGALFGAIVYSNVSRCYSTGRVESVNVSFGGIEAGGLIGIIAMHSNVSECYSTVDVYGEYVVGGFAGAIMENTKVTDCYARGNATAYVQRVGGFASYCVRGNITNCFSTGLVTGPAEAGGFVGVRITGSGYADVGNFWDNQTSGQTTSAMGTGKYTVEMKQNATFDTAGWDINISNVDLNDGYPYLGWQNHTATSVWLIYYEELLVFDINITSFDLGVVQKNSLVYSNKTGAETMRIYNNGTVNIDIDINATNATASGVSPWVLSASNGDNMFKLEIYNSTTGWVQVNLTRDTWYVNMVSLSSFTANFRVTTPTVFYSGKQMSFRVYMWASVH